MNKYQSARRAILVSALLLSTASQNATAAIPSAYRVTDLGTLGGTYTFATGINNVGQVTGSSTLINTATRPFLWTPTTSNGTTGTMIDLGTLGGTKPSGYSNYGFDVNDIGQVTGTSFTTGTVFLHAFLYDGTMHDLGTLGGVGSDGRGINNSGQVVGYASATGNSAVRTYLWTPTTSNGSTGTMIDLGTLGGSDSFGEDVNAVGHVAGDSYLTADGDEHAFLWDGTMHDLGISGGATAINDNGQVAGSSYTDAFLWTPTTQNGSSGTVRDLGTLGGPGSRGLDLNIQGQVVGTSTTAGGAAIHAFLYDSSSNMVDLNSLIDPLSGWELAQATGINDFGQITGNGIVAGQSHAFLLTPVPEPVSLALLMLGLPPFFWRHSLRCGTRGIRGHR